jgi:hypothetical protein
MILFLIQIILLVLYYGNIILIPLWLAWLPTIIIIFNLLIFFIIIKIKNKIKGVKQL